MKSKIILLLILISSVSFSAIPRKLPDSLFAKVKKAPNKAEKFKALFTLSRMMANYNLDTAKIIFNDMKQNHNPQDPKEQLRLSYMQTIINAIEKKGDINAQFLDLKQKAESLKDEEILARSLNNLAQIEMSKPDRKLNIIESYAKPALVIAKKMNDHILVNRVWNLLCGIYTWKNDFNGEVEERKRLYEWNMQAKDTMDAGITLNGIALLYSFKGYSAECIPWAEKALVLFKAIDFKEFIANEYEIIGDAYQVMGNSVRALDYYLKSYKIHEQTGYLEGMGYCLNCLGSIYKTLKNNKQSIESYKKALDIFLKAKNEVSASSVYLSLGYIFFENNQKDSAFVYFNKSKELSYKNNYISGKGYSCIALAKYETDKKNNAAAINYLKEAKTLFESVIENDGQKEVYVLWSQIYLSEKKYKETIETALKAMKFAEITRNMESQKIICDILSAAYSNTNNYKEAYFYKNRAYILSDSLLNADKSREIGKLEANYQTERKLEAEKKAQEEKQRKEDEEREKTHTIEYLGVIIFIVGSILFVFILRRRNLKIAYIERFLFLIFLLFFEFLTILIESPIDSFSNNDPLINILVAVVLAVLVSPLHERLLNKILSKIKKDKEQEQNEAFYL